MTEVGIQELHDHLSAYLKRVEDGERIVVTNRGRRIALLEPMPGPPGLDRMIAEGRAHPPTRPKEDIDFDDLPTLTGDGPTLSDMVIEDRRRGY